MIHRKVSCGVGGCGGVAKDWADVGEGGGIEGRAVGGGTSLGVGLMI